MSFKQQDAAAMGIILKIGVIAGCPLPSDQKHLNALEDELKKLLIEDEGFSQLTFEEILSAFRFNASGKYDEKINHWQSILNMDFIGSVLLEWIKLRKKIEKKEQQEKLRISLIEPNSHPFYSAEEVVQSAKEIWALTNYYLFLPSKAYDKLVVSGHIKLNPDDKLRIRSSARKEMDKVHSVDSFFYYNSDTEVMEQRIAKKIALANYFEQIEGSGCLGVSSLLMIHR
jgi:hypothetical protein